MEIGTIETIPEPRKKRKSRKGRTGGFPPSGGGGGGFGGGGGDRSNGEPYDESLDSYPDKARIITWFLLVVVLMTFGGLVGAYVVVSTNQALEWRPFDLPVQVWISTVLIFLSSGAYIIAKKAIDNDDQPTAKKWLIVTTVLGAAFISSQLLAWIELVGRGLYMYANPYAGFFYILTAVHVVHVIGGIVALGAVVSRCWVPVSSEREHVRTRYLARSVGHYWHFIGAIWVVLLILLGFWK